MRIIIATLIAAVVLTLAPPAPAEAQRRQSNAPPSGMQIFALVGQSNMFGTQPIPIPTPPPPDQRIWSLDPVNGWRVAQEPLFGWINPATPGSATGFGGPGMPFAQELLARNPSMTIGLVTCAHPGRIRDWLPGSAPLPNATDGASNYYRCLNLLHYAKSVGTLAGIIAYQGEADTSPGPVAGFQPAAAGSWGQYYSQVVSALRRDLALPELPAVNAQLANHTCGPSFPDWDAVKVSQSVVPLTRSTWIRTDDLPGYSDCIHLNAASEAVVGQRFAAAWWAMAGSTPPPPGNATCQPVVVVKAITGPGAMLVVVSKPAGTISGVTFGPAQNVQPITDLHGLGTQYVGFTVRRAAPGPVTQPFTVHDTCGSWKTLVGGGAGAF
jgi:hypothetical protein